MGAEVLIQRVQDLAASVGLVNHATFSAQLTVTEAYDVVGSLADVVHRLSQLAGFLARVAEAADPAEYFDDRGLDPRGAVGEAAQALSALTADLDALSVHTSAAHNALGHLGRPWTPEEVGV